jgi:hypothetical protein
MKKLLLPSLILLTFNSFGQNFYDRATVQSIEVFFASPSWDAQLDAATATDTYVIADSVRINGVTFDSVGVKYKGNSSYNANNNKNPMHLQLDYIKGSQDYQGYRDVKLQNGYQDPSMIREVLSYAILEQYMDCPKANFANVFVNGTLRGIYSNAESIDEKFNGDHYYVADQSTFKCNPTGGAGPGTTVYPDLKYINMDSSSYFAGYELKSPYGWNRLVDLINTLNNNFTNIEAKIDIDRAIWMLAYNNVLVNLDSYSGAFRQNYYLTWDLNNRFVPTIWDLNMSFNGFPGGTGSGSGSSSMDPMSNSTSANHPLIKKILGDPMYNRMYMAHLRTIVQEIFANQTYLTMANSLRTTIDASVQADPYKFYTYAQYQNSLTTAVTGGGPGGSSIPGIQTLMDGRVTYFNTNSNYILVAPTINSYATNNNTPTYGSSIYITANCSGESSVYLGYRLNHQLKFNRVQMFDDGAHFDGAAVDHIYGVQVVLNGVDFEYYIYAENSNAGIFSPQRAEHEYHSLNISMPYATNGNVLINEVLASNSNYGHDSNDESDDWVELYNTKNTGIDLSGMYLSDDPLNLMKWAFPLGTAIDANDYLIVWADNDVIQSGLHANFKLSSLGDNIIFSNGATIFDQISLSAQTTDISYARCPDGAANFMNVTPTFNATNTCQVGISEINLNNVRIYPVPFSSDLTFNADGISGKELLIIDMMGREVFAGKVTSDSFTVSGSEWNSGVYSVRIADNNGIFFDGKVIKF